MERGHWRVLSSCKSERKHNGMNAVVKGEGSIGIYKRRPLFSKLEVTSYTAGVECDTGDWGSGGWGSGGLIE